ncbi:hypothetical protein J7W08_09235 [Methanococcoides orientis]|uniref:hypothetical protein n=1 Tax=Methanococcoides orientis TaxID=2822137 RepID=UPI001E32D564|nr:hypothetical protein [Methanococcoides orientis]UGV40258.1 hypothetical protein J7W08_09235 [Methanococcoides orientis]
MTAKEIKENLFPLRAASISASKEQMYTNERYYPTMKDQTLNVYLKKMSDFGLIEKIQLSDKRRSAYRALTFEKEFELRKTAPKPSIKEMIHEVAPEDRDRFKRNAVKGNPEKGTIGSDALVMMNPTYFEKETSEQLILDAIDEAVKAIHKDLVTTEQDCDVKVHMISDRFKSGKYISASNITGVDICVKVFHD